MAQHLSTVGMKDFEEGLELLKGIKSRWDEGKKLSVTDLNTDDISGNIGIIVVYQLFTVYIISR